jgi:hypothetical protein
MNLYFKIAFLPKENNIINKSLYLVGLQAF